MFKMYVSINEFPLPGSAMQFDSSGVSDSRHCEEKDFNLSCRFLIALNEVKNN